MKTEYRVYTAWSPFWSQMGPNHKFPPSMFLKSIGDMRPLFTTKRACKEWIADDKGRNYFKMRPGKVTVTVAWDVKEARDGTD